MHNDQESRQHDAERSSVPRSFGDTLWRHLIYGILVTAVDEINNGQDLSPLRKAQLEWAKWMMDEGYKRSIREIDEKMGVLDITFLDSLNQ